METISLLILIDKMRILNGWIIIILLLLVIIANIEQQGTVVLTFLFCFVFFDQNRQTVSLTSFLNNFHYIWFRLSNLDSVPKKKSINYTTKNNIFTYENWKPTNDNQNWSYTYIRDIVLNWILFFFTSDHMLW